MTNNNYCFKDNSCNTIRCLSKCINNKRYAYGSLALYNKKALVVYGAYDKNKCNKSKKGMRHNCPPSVLRDITYRLPVNQRRVLNKGGTGIHVKHNSYDRYLTRKVGTVLKQNVCKT